VRTCTVEQVRQESVAEAIDRIRGLPRGTNSVASRSKI
jgi:hypothetical protein